ncbi:hypothetical protein [Paenibacillus sp. IITD108]|uniref:hypothetical protein n=1 Tax=Paenibacillus sp. IITD108 TaxID=3116649 RepID=UPI002F41217E
MRLQDVIIGKFYQHKSTPNYAYARAIDKLKPKERENINNYAVVKCQWSVDKSEDFGLIKYFRPSDLVEEK